jgi:hypothetical protein
VVATRAATRALGVTPSCELLIADEATEFANAVFAGLDRDAAAKLARQARRYVERHHNWSATLAGLDALLEHSDARHAQSDCTAGMPAFALSEAARVK